MNPERNEGALGVKFSDWMPFWGSYNILDTDYETYTIVYSCMSAFWGWYSDEYFWILTRDPLSEDMNSRKL